MNISPITDRYPFAGSFQEAEVAWYRKHGRYPNHRIKMDGTGKNYVIGDKDWNKLGRPAEHIEREMHFYLGVPS